MSDSVPDNKLSGWPSMLMVLKHNGKYEITGIDTYSNLLYRIYQNKSKSWKIKLIAALGHEANKGDEQLNITYHLFTKKGYYISSNSNEEGEYSVRIRSEFDDHGHYETITNTEHWSFNRYSLDRYDYLYVCNGNQIIVFDTNNYVYQGGCTEKPLNIINKHDLELYDERNELCTMLLIAIDKHDNIYIANECDSSFYIYKNIEGKLIQQNKFDNFTDIQSIRCVEDNLFLLTCDSLNIYKITQKDENDVVIELSETIEIDQ